MAVVNLSVSERDSNFESVKDELDRLLAKCRDMKIPCSVSVKTEEDRIHLDTLITYTYTFNKMP